MTVDRAYTLELLAELVRIPSINPDLCGGRVNESAIAAACERRLAALGVEATRVEFAPGRPSVVGRLPGSGRAPSLLLYAHCDTVDVEGMAEPFSGEIRDGRLFGRGSYDMKGGLAACFGALEALVRRGTPPPGDVYLGAIADEETTSLGMQAVLERFRFDRAIVTEPTGLRVCVAHKGFAWLEVETRGVAAHGSRFREGVDANLRMGRFLERLDRLERELRERPAHSLLDTPSLHVGRIEGGTGPSTYAARAIALVERRSLPGESTEGIVAELDAILEALRREDPTFDAACRVILARPAFEAREGSAVVASVQDAVASLTGHRPLPAGETWWMDAALLAQAGVDTVVFGPAGAGAHAAEEFVEVDSVLQVADVLLHVARGGRG